MANVTIGIALALAVTSLVIGLVSMFTSLALLDRLVKVAQRTDALELKVAALEGHRLRIDTNVLQIAQHVKASVLANGVPIAAAPERTQ